MQNRMKTCGRIRFKRRGFASSVTSETGAYLQANDVVIEMREKESLTGKAHKVGKGKEVKIVIATKEESKQCGITEAAEKDMFKNDEGVLTARNTRGKKSKRNLRKEH